MHEITTRHIPLDQIVEPRTADRARITADEITELAISIREQGLINPILVRCEGALYEIIAGNRRYLAHKYLGKPTIEAKVADADDGKAAELRFTENIQRSDLTPLEEALAVRRLKDNHGLSVAEIAQRTAKSDGWVRLRLQLLDWPEDIIKRIATLELPLGVAGHLAAITDQMERARLTHIAIESGANARTVMGWRAAWESSQTPVDTNAPPTNDPLVPYSTPEPLFPCWSCERPTHLLKLYILRFCPDCVLALSAAKSANKNAVPEDA